MRDETRFTRRRLVQMSSLVLCGLIAVGVLVGGPVTAASDTPGARDAARVELRASTQPCANNQPPKASFTRPTVATVGQPVTFTSTSSDPEGQPLQHFWFSSDNEFGFKQGPQATHTFTKPGRYHVLLQVRDSCGATSNAEVFIDALEPAPPGPTGNTADNQPAQIPRGPKVVVQRRGFLSYVIGRFLEHVRGSASFVATNVGGSAARRVLLGRKRFEAQPGRVVRVRVKLTRGVLRALKRRGRMRVRLVVNVVDDGGNRSRRTTNLTLKARR